jgi:hypothetical protein
MTDIERAAAEIRAIIARLPDETSRQDALRLALEGRCPKCLEESPEPRWCCYESRGD